NLRTYHAHLARQLRFPFRANRVEAALEPVQYRRYRITVNALLAAEEGDTDSGLLCEAVEEGETIQMPLADIKNVAAGPNRQLVEDYQDWFWNEASEGGPITRWIESVLLPSAESPEGEREQTPLTLWGVATTLFKL